MSHSFEIQNTCEQARHVNKSGATFEKTDMSVNSENKNLFHQQLKGRNVQISPKGSNSFALYSRIQMSDGVI